MDHIPEPSGKSLLLQTVALFETLLLKIQSMKNEKETMTEENLRLTACLQSKCTVEDDLKVTEAKLQSVNEVREGRKKYFVIVFLRAEQGSGNNLILGVSRNTTKTGNCRQKI